MPGRIVRRAGDVPTRSLWTKIKDVALTDVGAIVRGGAIQGSLEKLEEVLNIELNCIQERHGTGKKIFDQLGASLPAFGMVGTLIGLIQMLHELDDPT